MARYIDADKVLDAMMSEMAGTGHQARAMAVIRYAETADVVPKSEVEKLRFNLEAVLEEIPETKREVAREIFEEIDRIVSEYCDRFIPPTEMVAMLFDLKKKYVESEGKE